MIGGGIGNIFPPWKPLQNFFPQGAPFFHHSSLRPYEKIFLYHNQSEKCLIFITAGKISKKKKKKIPWRGGFKFFVFRVQFSLNKSCINQTGKWAHINVKLHVFPSIFSSPPPSDH